MTHPREKDTVEDHRRLDVRALHRSGVLQPGFQTNWSWSRDGRVVSSIGLHMQDSDRLRLHYRLTRHDKTEQLDYPVPITWTACHLGGQRPWFLCPCCGHRVAILYLNRVFACRQCQRLNYASQQASKRDRPFNQSQKLRQGLGCDATLFDIPAEYLPRPKGMHRRTFARKLARLQRVDAIAMQRYTHFVTVLQASLERIQQRLKP